MKKLLCLLLSALMLTAAGCAKPAQETSDVSETSSGVAVHVDYSKLTPYDPPEETYTLHKGYTQGEGLKAQDDYGALLPYYGKHVVLDAPIEDYVCFDYYGLVTAKGELVTDPIYTFIEFTEDGKYVILYRGNPDYEPDYENANGTPMQLYTVAAADGRWVHTFTDCDAVYCNAGLIITKHSDGTATLWNADGEELQHFDIAATFDSFDVYTWDLQSAVYWKDDKVGKFSYSDEAERYLIFETGEVLDTPPEGYSEDLEDYYIGNTEEPNRMSQCPNVEGCAWEDYFTDPVTEKTYFYGKVGDHSYYTLFDADGNVMAEPYCALPIPSDKRSLMVGVQEFIDKARDGLYVTVENDRFCYRALGDGALVFCHAIQANID